MVINFLNRPCHCSRLCATREKVWRDSTRYEYEKAFNLHVKQVLGSKRLDKIKRLTVKTFLAQLKEKGLSPSRSKTVKNLISGVLNNAIEDELI